MIGWVTFLGGLSGLLCLSAGVTTDLPCRWVTRPAGVAFMLQKDQMSQTVAKRECVKNLYIS